MAEISYPTSKSDPGRSGGKNLADYCADTGLPLLAEWDQEKNLPLLPEAVSAGSHKAVWWQCPQGHSWRAQVRSRVHGAGCPVCARRKLIKGSNDLQTAFPQLAAQWDLQRNAPLRPDQVLPGSGRYAWWRCERGHVWRATIISRTRGRGCPVCAGHKAEEGFNDLSSFDPRLAAQWDSVRNGTLTPAEVTAYSNKKVWWRCELGHSWQAPVSARVFNRSACPYCSGKKVLAGFNDLAAREPLLAQQWDAELNGNLTPEMVTLGSHKRVWWRCNKGHVWKAVVYSRTGSDKCGCPVCAGVTRRSSVKVYG